MGDLKGPDVSWSDAFDGWSSSSSPDVHRRMDKMQIIHECKDCRDDHFHNRAHNQQHLQVAPEIMNYSRLMGDGDYSCEEADAEVLCHLSEIDKISRSKAAEQRERLNSLECLSTVCTHLVCHLQTVPPRVSGDNSLGSTVAALDDDLE